MQMKPIKSSNIKAVGYEPTTNRLRVQFGNGQEYDYTDVSIEKYNALMAADSQGRYFHQYIKGACDSTKCEKET